MAERRPRQQRSNKIPERLLDEILGKTSMRNPESGRNIQKKGMLKKGRKDAGPKNPRGDFSGRSVEEQLRSGVGQLPQMTVEDMIMRQMGVANPAGVPMDQNQMLDMMMGGKDEPSAVPGIEADILQQMGVGVDPMTTQGTTDAVVPGRNPPPITPRDAVEANVYAKHKPPVRGYYSNEQELYPNYASGGYGPSMQGDPAFEAAHAEWMRINGREPMTDGELAEVESMMTSGDVSRSATEGEIIKNVTGTRPAQGPISDDEELPASDRIPPEELIYDEERDGVAGATAPVPPEQLAEMDPQEALMMSMGDEWSPEDYAIMQSLSPEERVLVYQDIMENDFMTDPLAPFRR